MPTRYNCTTFEPNCGDKIIALESLEQSIGILLGADHLTDEEKIAILQDALEIVEKDSQEQANE